VPFATEPNFPENKSHSITSTEKNKDMICERRKLGAWEHGRLDCKRSKQGGTGHPRSKFIYYRNL
jgi:hypothetical protein